MSKVKTRNRTYKLHYYLTHLLRIYVTPNYFHRRYKRKCLSLLREEKLSKEIFDRVNYCNKLSAPFELKGKTYTNNGIHKTYTANNAHVKKSDINSSYRYDFCDILRFFDPEFSIAFTMGDVTFNPEIPSVLKSRPIAKRSNVNSVLLKLDKIRHFNFIEDHIPYEKKGNKLMWRGAAPQPHRKKFLRDFFDHPSCDAAQVKAPDEYGYGHYLSIEDQLHSKFILCIEGYDVATNLKWAMSSNSLCFMQKPKYETWFMEGRLVPGTHYVELNEDYSNLEEKIDYYQTNMEEAKFIIHNANNYLLQFNQKIIEDLVAILVLEKYFHLAGEIHSSYADHFQPTPPPE